jgi:hypothetical protein
MNSRTIWATPILAEDGDAADFFKSFGVDPPGTTPPPADPPTDPNPAADPPTDPNPAGDPPTDPNPAGDPPTDPPVEPKPDDKANNAFAQMRIQNKNLSKLVDVAKLLKVDNAPDKEAAIRDAVIKAQSKQQGVPEELLRRLSTLEDADAKLKQVEFERSAYLGFQKVKDTFKLTDAELQSYSDQLFAKGMNPFQQQVDLVNEYRNMNFDRLMEAAVQRGIQQEAARAAKANQFGTTPNNRQGQGGTEPSKVTTLSELNNWFDQSK